MDVFGKLKNNLEETNIYICHTYYHLLISIIKQLKSKVCSDIMLVADEGNKNNFLATDYLLINRLKASKIFGNIIIFDYSEEEIMKKKRLVSFYKMRLGNKIIREKKYNLFKYKKIYIFNDHGLIGYILNKQKIFYHLLEDGMDCFKFGYNEAYTIGEKNPIKRFIKRYLKIYEGIMESPYIKTVEVNDKSNLFIKHANIIECPKKELFLSLSSKEKEEILKIFLEKMDDLVTSAESILILTQPLSEDNICSNEEEKINLYKKIIKQYGLNENIIIKTHPREHTDYLKYFKEYRNVKIIKERFPVEVIIFFNIKFIKVITIFSTSINLIDNCNQKIELGYEYINNKLEKK